MNRSKSIVTTYLSLMIVVSAVLFIIPFVAQLAVAPVTASASNQPVFTLHRSMMEPTMWSESIDIQKEFDAVKPFPAGTNINVDLNGNYRSSFGGLLGSSRNVTMKYTLYCNGVEAIKYRHYVTTPGSIQGAEHMGWMGGGLCFSQEAIPENLVKSGQNVILVHVEIDSVQIGDGPSSFNYTVNDVAVKANYLDSDGDGVPNFLDVTPSINNVNTLALTGFIGFPPSVIFGKKLAKSKKH